MCDYTGAEDMTHEVVEELEDDVIMQRMVRLVGVGVVVATECTVIVFSANRRPDLVSRSFPCLSICPWSVLVGDH